MIKKPLKVARLLKVAFVVLGMVLVCLSVLLPFLMEIAAARHGPAANFESAYLRSLTPFITIASMASSFIAAAVILSFEKSKPSRMSVPFGVLTFSVFATEIAVSIYISDVRSPSQIALTHLMIYALIGLVPFGLACTMFTLASMMPNAL